MLRRKAKDIVLQLYIKDQDGWPTENFTVTDLIKGIYRKQYKYTFTDSSYTEEKVMEMMISGEIDTWLLQGNRRR